MSLNTFGAWRLLWAVIGAQRTLLTGLLVLALGVAACELALPWFIQEAVDAALGERAASSLDAIGLSMLGIIAVLYVLHMLLLRTESSLLYGGSFQLRQRLYTTLLYQPLAFFHRKKQGELQHRVLNDTDGFETHSVYVFSDLPFDLLTVFGVVTIMFITDARLALLALGFLAVASVISAYIGQSLPELQQDVQSSKATLNVRLHEALAGIRLVKAFGRERYEIERMDQASRRVAELETQGGRVESYLVPILELMEILGVVLVIWYGAHLMVIKEITPGNLVAFLAYMEILAEPVGRTDKHYRHFQKLRAVSGRITAFLSELVLLPAPARPAPPEATPNLFPIAFKDVSFVYPGNTRPTLSHVDCTIQPEEIVAVVGKNGSGKSTLMDLLLGFYSPTSGRITTGGIDLTEWDLQLWRKQIGFMGQDVFLIHGTIAENIAYGRPEATRQEVETAAIQANLSDLLEQLPDGLDTVVGDRGQRLSGGQRQRIALARLFLRNPQLLIFDEPTAHLDAEAARETSRLIAELAKSRTVLLVSHRPETLALAKRILLLDGGKVVADALPDVLANTEPLFRSLALEGASPTTGLSKPRRTVPEANTVLS